MLPEDGQELRPKHVGAIIAKHIVQQYGIECCIMLRGDTVSRKVRHVTRG
jgi:hypothetical protein